MASPLEYNSITKNFLSSEPFLQSSVDERESMLRRFTDEYVSNNPDLGEDDVNKIYEVAQIRNNTQRQFDNAGRKTPSPEELQASGLQIPDITKFKSVDDGIEVLDQFKEQVEATTTFDPLNEKDYKFTLSRYTNELERELRGEKTGPLVDKGYRFMQGIAGGFIRSVGADEAAEEFETTFFPENIAYDDTKWSKFSQAGGDFVASSVIFLATTALTKNPNLGLAASIGSTGIRRYQDSYRQVFADTGNEYLAQDAALATLPAAAIEGFGERIIFGKFFGKEGTKQFAEVFRGARGTKAKQEALMSAFRDTSKRKAIYQGFVGEGFTESAGDAYAGLAMAEITGNKDYIPSLGELGETFVISGILGGGASGFAQSLSNISPQSQQIRADAKQLQQLIKDGKTIEAAQLTSDIQDKYEANRELALEITGQKPQIELGTSQEPTTAQPPVDREAGLQVDENVQPLQFDPKVREEVAKLDQINKLEDDINAIQSENLLKKPTKEGRTISKKGEKLAAPLTEEQQTLKAELEAALPNRQRVFSEFDTLAKEVENISEDQIAVEKRYWDHLAKVYASKTGLTIDSFYENIAIQSTEQVGKSQEDKGSSIGVNLESGQDVIPETFSETEKVDLVFSEIANKVGDLSTMHHELWHSLRLSGIPNKVLEVNQMQALENAYNLERNDAGEAVWTRDADESFARDYETWLRNPGQSLGKFDPELKSIFTKIKDWMREIYRVLSRPLSVKQSKSGATIADINPDVRKAFEALHQINPEFLAQDPTLETETESVVSQRTSALQEGPSVVDGVIKNSPESESEVAENTTHDQIKKAPEALLQSNDKQQRMKEAVNAKPVYEQTDADTKRLNWLNRLSTTQRISKNIKTGLDASYAKLLKEFAALGNIVTKDEELGTTFFNLLENFHNSRRVVASPDQRAFGPNPAENQGNVTQDAINHLKGYYDQALNLWFKDQQAKYSDVIDGFDAMSLDDFGSRSAVVSWINQQITDNAKADNYDQEGEQEQESDPYGDIILDYAGQLNSPEYQAPILKNVVRLGRGLFNRHIKLQNRFVDYLKSITPEQVAIMSNAEKVLHFYAMDNLVQDNSYVGASLLLNNDVNKDLNPDVVARNKNKFRPQYKGMFGKAAGYLRSNDLNLKTLTLYQEQREFLRSLAKDFEQIGIGEYQESSKHLRETLTQLRRKHFGKLGPDLENLYRLGIFSKLIQTPSDLDENQKNEYVRNSYEDILASIEELKKGTDQQVATSLRLNSLLNEVTNGLAPDFGFREISEVAGGNLNKAELGYLNDVIEYLDQYSEVFKFVTEFVHGKPFRYMDNYVPTEQIPNDPSKAEKDTINGLSIEDQHLDLNNFQDPHTQIKTSQVTTSMQRNRRRKGFHYNFNFDSLVERKSRLTLFDIYTAYDRKLLAAKLRSEQLLDILTPNDRTIVGQNRVNFLTEMYKNTVHTELHENAYYNEIERGFNFMFHKLGAVALSSIHNAVSQPLAAYSHHLFRNPIAARHYPQAMMAVTKAIANEMSGSTNPNDVGNKIRNLLNIGLGERNILGDPLLNQSHLLSADASIIKRALNTTVGKYAKLANRYIENLQFGPLRLGDISSARTIFLSEYVQSEINAGRASSFSDVDWDVINTESLATANRSVDENVNASRNSRRGSVLARPMSVMRLLTLFSSHRINVATEAANALRDLNEGLFNVAKNVARGEPISKQDVQATKDAFSYIAAAIAQSVTFTSAKYGINAGIAVTIVKALQGIYDDEDEYDEKEVALIQDNIDDFKRFNQDPLALRQSLLRDSTGNLIWISSFGGLDNAVYTNVADPVFKHFHELGQKDILEYYNEEIARARRQKKKRTLAILLAQKKAVEDQNYIPLGFGKFSGADVGGAYGALANNISQPLSEATKWTVSDEELDVTELVILSSVFGLGQADLNRMLRAVDKIQDDVNDKRNKEREKQPVR